MADTPVIVFGHRFDRLHKESSLISLRCDRCFLGKAEKFFFKEHDVFTEEVIGSLYRKYHIGKRVFVSVL